MRDGSNFNIALIKENQGEYADAINFYERTISVTKNSQIKSAAYNNLIGLLMRMELIDEAGKVCQRALEANPKDDNAWSSLGVIFLQEKKEALSRECFEHALEVSDGMNAVALNNLGTFELNAGNIDAAEDYFKRAMNVDPYDESSLFTLACILKDKKKYSAAAILLRELLELNPEHSQAPFLLSLMLGDTPDCAPASYVADLFDHYCTNGYDAHMLDSLSYAVPDLLYDRIVDALEGGGATTDHKSLRYAKLKSGTVIDLGCGTGLCARRLQQDICADARFLGCDLSTAMVLAAQELQAKDGERALYESVAVADCVQFLHGLETRSADLVIAGDVLVYIGSLTALFQEVKRVLKPGAMFAFTVETLDESVTPPPSLTAYTLEDRIAKGFILHEDLRYAHTKEYVKNEAKKQYFIFRSEEDVILRYSENQPVKGFAFLFTSEW